MASLKDLKNRIESVKSTRKITKAMQMVAAAKLRRAQDFAESARPYADSMKSVLSNLAKGASDDFGAPKLLAGNGRSNIMLLIVATSERGLCGGFNSSIVKIAKSHAAKYLKEGKTVKIFTIGKKGREQLKRDFGQLMIGHFDMSTFKGVPYSVASEISKNMTNLFEDNEFDVATIFYSQFQSVLVQNPTAQQLIPVLIEETDMGITSYDYEPDKDLILTELLPQAITTKIFTALLENGASEQGARMSAMDNATRNAGEMIDKLTIKYNRSRQAAITNELIEIISGAEAL
jgi:F-type H+-transporting ATPase subunit gamma